MSPATECLAGAAALSAAAAIACDWRERRRAFYLLKPLTTALVIALAIMSASRLSLYAQLVIAALVLCMLGDVALMWDSDRAFIAGLSSFLLAHLLFAAAFGHGLPQLAPGHYALAGLVFGAAGLALLMPRAGKLRLPVFAYVLVLLAMWLAADARFSQLADPPSALALIGATVFIASDSLLAWNKFLRPLPLAQPLILGTYYPAILLIALSAG